IGVLPVRPEQRRQCSELEPAQVQLLPLAAKFRRHFGDMTNRARAVVTKTVFGGKSSDVEGPPRHAGETRSDTGGNLFPQVRPARADITTPDGRAGTLYPTEPGACQDNAALVRVGFPLSEVYRLGMRRGVRVEVLGAGPQRVRRQQFLSVLDGKVRMHVGLDRVQPPRIEAKDIQARPDLAPVQVPAPRIERIVERVEIAGSYPVEILLLDVLVEHTVSSVERLVVSSRRIKLRPHRNHDVRVQFMYPVDHRPCIGKVLLIEVVASPGVL